MPNRTVHAIGAAVGIGLVHVAHERDRGLDASGLPVVSAVAAGYLGSIPDLLEPATNPNHRQFCHSVVAGLAVLWGLKKLYEWDPTEDGAKFLRYLGLVAGGAYAIHLALDAMTKRSLPLVGRI